MLILLFSGKKFNSCNHPLFRVVNIDQGETKAAFNSSDDLTSTPGELSDSQHNTTKISPIWSGQNATIRICLQPARNDVKLIGGCDMKAEIPAAKVGMHTVTVTPYFHSSIAPNESNPRSKKPKVNPAECYQFENLQLVAYGGAAGLLRIHTFDPTVEIE